MEIVQIPAEVLAHAAERYRGSGTAFGNVWQLAENLYARATDPATQEYLSGVIATCRWLAIRGIDDAQAIGIPLPPSPGGRRVPVMPETLDEEQALARRRRAQQRRRGETGDRQHGIASTFEWARDGGRAPVDNDYCVLFDALND